jgi:putative cell wall-binding protein/streptogramin lyase
MTRRILISALLTGILAAVVVAPLPAAAAPFVPGTETRFALPHGGGKPTAIAAGADALWVAESNGQGLVRVGLDGKSVAVPLPCGASPTDVAVGGEMVWWISSTGKTFGSVTGGVVSEKASAAGSTPTAVAADSRDGSGWFFHAGAAQPLEHRPADPAGAAEAFAVGHGITAASGLLVVGDQVWISDPSANLIVVMTTGGVFVRSIPINAPSKMTVGDGGVYVVSEAARVIRLSSTGGVAAEWGYDDLPLITGVVAAGREEVWTSQHRGRAVRVKPPLEVSTAEHAKLPDAAGPSGIALGADGAIWYTAFDTGEVVRVARDYEAPGVGVTFGGYATRLFGYEGEPLGPFVAHDRGSGEIRTHVGGTLPPGMRLEALDGDTIVGTPTTVGTTQFIAEAQNTFYGGISARSLYKQSIVIRERPAIARVDGADRYAVAVKASQRSFPTTAVTVYLASGEKFADALSAGPVAIGDGAPLLLTSADRLPDVVAAELKRLGPIRVVIVGGTASVTEAVERQVRSSGAPGLTVERVGGADRYEVSRALIRRLPAATSIYIASGLNYPDALSAAPVASRQAGVGVLLVDGPKAALPAETMGLLDSRAVASVKIAGGPASVSEAIRSQLETSGRTVVRLGGADRYEASISINRDALTLRGYEVRAAGNPVPLVATASVYIASGEKFPDALSGGVAAGLSKSPLYVVKRACIPRPVLLDIGSSTATSVAVLGGTATLEAPVDALAVCP